MRALSSQASYPTLSTPLSSSTPFMAVNQIFDQLDNWLAYRSASILGPLRRLTPLEALLSELTCLLLASAQDLLRRTLSWNQGLLDLGLDQESALRPLP